MSINLELEIKSFLLKEEPTDQATENIIQYVENTPDGFTSADVITLCQFLIQGKAYAALVKFVFKHWDKKDFIIPWPYFLKALEPILTIELAEILWEAISETKGFTQACRSPSLDQFYPPMVDKRERRRQHLIVNLRKRREELEAELSTLHDRQLFEREKALLRRLIRMYPHDSDLLSKSSDLQARGALEIIAKHAPLRRSIIWDDEKNNPEMEKAAESWSHCLLEAAARTPEVVYELAIAAYMIGLFETSLKILDLEPDQKKHIWFRLEVLLQSRRYLDLLGQLAQVEIHFSVDPETFFATAYLRAQAMWGLGQKQSALEVMESLLTARPGYRLGLTLLSQWRDR